MVKSQISETLSKESNYRFHKWIQITDITDVVKSQISQMESNHRYHRSNHITDITQTIDVMLHYKIHSNQLEYV